MKRNFSFLTLLALLSIALSGCFQDKCEQQMTYLTYTPVYQSLSSVRQAVGMEAARELKQPGKMYYKDGYLFISEVNKGIHIIDNTDPRQPQNLAFLAVPGNHDIAAKGNILYADSYMDLVAIDISLPTQAREVGRELDVFPYGTWHNGLWADPDSGIAVDWIEREVTEEVECSNVSVSPIWSVRNTFSQNDAVTREFSSLSSNSNLGSGSMMESAPSSGQGGSMARFTLLHDHLYVVTTHEMIIFNVSSLQDPVEQNRISIGWDIETIFPRGNTLFLGSMTGMHIYGVTDPINPTWLSSIQHVQACDPVVADDEYAYVTIRDGNACAGTVNDLLVIDIQQLTSPVLRHTYQMFNPHGLGISGETLFICDGDEGLKVYDATDVSKITANLVAHFPDIHAFDVIPLGDVLLMIGKDGFYQYDYTDLTNIQLLSFLPVGQ